MLYDCVYAYSVASVVYELFMLSTRDVLSIYSVGSEAYGDYRYAFQNVFWIYVIVLNVASEEYGD